MNLFRKKPAPQPVRTPIRIAPVKPLLVAKRDELADEKGRLLKLKAQHVESAESARRSADLHDAISRDIDAMLAINDRATVDLDMHEEAKIKALDSVFDADITGPALALPNISEAIADAPVEVLEAAE